MPYQIFVIPASDPEEGLKEFNQFLASHRVVDVDKRFHADGPSASWHFCVNYAVKRAEAGDGQQTSSKYGGTDYKKVLSPDDFAIYAKLREVRKQIAEEKSIQLFTIVTNKQLADLATRRVRTMEQLRAIDGIGEKKAAAFGQHFLEAIAAETSDERAETADATPRSSGDTAGGSLFPED